MFEISILKFCDSYEPFRFFVNCKTSYKYSSI